MELFWRQFLTECRHIRLHLLIHVRNNHVIALQQVIESIKKDKLQQMECKLNDLKNPAASMIENFGTNRTFADASRSTHSVQEVEQLNRSRSSTSYVDEGYGDQSGTSVNRPSSKMQHKTPYDPDTTDSQHKTRTKYIPQPFTVRMTNRSMLNQCQSTKDASIKSVDRENKTVHHKRILIIGDSILKGINTKGLNNRRKICAKGGSKISDMWEELSVYGLTSIVNVIICVRWNDCSSRLNVKTYEELYNQLIGLIRSVNKNCTIYLSKFTPRGDAYVTEVNNAIQRQSDHWNVNLVKCIEDRSNIFFSQHGMSSARYYSNDGIHLSRSGIKRLVDALNRHIEIVADFNFCMFKVSQFHEKRNERLRNNYSRNHNGRSGQSNRGWQFNGP